MASDRCARSAAGANLEAIALRSGLKQVAPAFYGGPRGVVRLSCGGLAPASPADRPMLSLREEHRLKAGEVVEAVIPLCRTDMRWHTGEQRLGTSRSIGLRRLPHDCPAQLPRARGLVLKSA